MEIIHLQAAHPERNAARNPSISTPAPTGWPAVEADAEPIRSFMSSRASPKMGGMTIRNENCASLSFLLPSMMPVAMVAPERDIPGRTAMAWAIPIMKAWKQEIFSLCLGLA